MSKPKKSASKLAVGVRDLAPTPNVFVPITGRDNGNKEFWRWGNDNLFPYALAQMFRCSTAHRRIINDKADYISGKGFTCDEEREPLLSAFISRANGKGENLRQVLNKLAFDKSLFGNAFLEVVTDAKGSFLSLFHQDASRCRVAYDAEHIILHHNWASYTKTEAKTLPIYPKFEPQNDGTLRAIIHYKDYEPMFENYGVPAYVAGLDVSAIAYKTNQWNISRLDRSYQLSGVMILSASTDNDEETREVVRKAEEKFAGKPGQVMFMVKEPDGAEGSKFIPISSSNEGDWKELHDQSTSDIVVAHSWFRSLSGLDYSMGFNADRIVNEYEVAFNTVIVPEQTELMEPIRMVITSILGLDTSSLIIINRPPITQKQPYMYIWEARKADGLDYDPTDEQQQAFVAQINKTNNA